MKVLEQCQEMKSEEGRFYDYKNELEVLEEERLAHVEELRQIHADMKAVSELIVCCTVIGCRQYITNRSAQNGWRCRRQLANIDTYIQPVIFSSLSVSPW